MTLRENFVDGNINENFDKSLDEVRQYELAIFNKNWLTHVPGSNQEELEQKVIQLRRMIPSRHTGFVDFNFRHHAHFDPRPKIHYVSLQLIQISI